MNILLHYRHFPISMGRYFDMALRDLGHDVVTVGCYNGLSIPWGPEYKFPSKYDNPPDIQVPDVSMYPLSIVLDELSRLRPGWKPDMVLQASDVSFLCGSTTVPNVVIGTDPHCIDYNPFLEHASHFFCMQHKYMKNYRFGNKFWMPYGYLPQVHFNEKNKHPKYDVVFVGLVYQHRKRLLDSLKDIRCKVFAKTGLIFDEYREAYNNGLISLNYSSKDDLPARFWEGMAMGRCVVTNYVPDMDQLDLPEDTYVVFNHEEQAVPMISDLLFGSGYEAKAIGKSAMKAVVPHTYQNRMKDMLDKVWQI